MKKDIKNIEDIKLFVNSFYDRVNKDKTLSYIFNDFSKVNWDKHLPRMYSFWSTLLFGEKSYKGSPFDKHIPLPVEKAHFARWVELFEATIDDLFQGEMAEHTKMRAKTIAWTFQSKLEFINKEKKQ